MADSVEYRVYLDPDADRYWIAREEMDEEGEPGQKLLIPPPDL